VAGEAGGLEQEECGDGRRRIFFRGEFRERLGLELLSVTSKRGVVFIVFDFGEGFGYPDDIPEALLHRRERRYVALLLNGVEKQRLREEF
jgi:hypothetical protein